MFENLVAKINDTSDGIDIHLQWRWRYDCNSELPRCNVFCCMIEESDLLSEAVFGESEILDWINKNRVGVCECERIENIRAYHRNPNNSKNCILRECQLQNGGNINATYTFNLSNQHHNKVFLLCIYGEETFEYRLLSLSSKKEDIKYEIITPTTFEKMFKKQKSTKIKIAATGRGRRAIVSKFNGKDIYSVLPYYGDEFFLDEDIEPSEIKKVVNLSSLIG